MYYYLLLLSRSAFCHNIRAALQRTNIASYLILAVLLIAFVLENATDAAPVYIGNTASFSFDMYYGLPHRDHCAFSYNNSLYIFGGQPNDVYFSLTFPSSFSSGSSGPAVTRLGAVHPQSALGHIGHGGGCAVTSYGVSIFLPPQSSNLTLDLNTSAWKVVTANEYGSGVATRSFGGANAKPELPRRDTAMALWNDILIVYGGAVMHPNSSTWTFDNTTFVLDMRVPTAWTWYQTPVTADTPPSLVTTRSVMVSTRRWILYLMTTPLNRSDDTVFPDYNVAVHCFDPYIMLWRGQVTNFTLDGSIADTVQAAAIPPPQTDDNLIDSVLITPTLSGDVINGTLISVNDMLALPPSTVWRLDMSTAEAKGTLTRITDNFRPVAAGGTVTTVSHDFIVLYGGSPFSHDSFRFYNAATSSFFEPSWWLDTPLYPSNQPSPSADQESVGDGNTINRLVAIILGTVLGALALVAVIAIVFCCCVRRRRQQQHDDGRQRNVANPTQRTTAARSSTIRRVLTPLSLRLGSTSPDGSDSWSEQLRRALSAIGARSCSPPSPPPPQQQQQTMTETESPAAPIATSSPQQNAALPLQPGKDNDDDGTASRKQKILSSSRFNEHFDLLIPSSSLTTHFHAQ